MEDSPLPVTKWVPAIWFILNYEGGTSSCEMSRMLAITQKSAWLLLRKIQIALT